MWGKRVVAAMTDPNPLVAGGGLMMLRRRVITEVGLLADDAERLNPVSAAHASRSSLCAMQAGMSLDGRTRWPAARASG